MSKVVGVGVGAAVVGFAVAVASVTAVVDDAADDDDVLLIVVAVLVLMVMVRLVFFSLFNLFLFCCSKLKL